MGWVTGRQAQGTGTGKVAGWSPCHIVLGPLYVQIVFEVGQHFITVMDALKLDQRAADQLQPTLNDLNEAILKLGDANFSGRAKLLQWLVKLNQMPASEELSEEEARQFLFDMETAYAAFHKTLQ